MTRELKIEIYGIVQGVNLRRSLSKYAKLLGLKGYVKNQPDGSVLVVGQGADTALEELLSWCQKATFPAKVNGMRYEWSDITQEYKKFEIEKDHQSFIKDEAQSLLNLSKEILRFREYNKIPRHVVIIPDGNRRWAREKGWHAWVGHRKSLTYERVKTYFDECKSLGIKYLSFWGFSTENWDRDEREIKVIFDLFRSNVRKYREEFMKEGIRFRHMGRKDRLPKDLIEDMQKLEEETKTNTKLNLQLCLDYGGRDDLVRAINRMIAQGVKKVDESVISDYLDTKGIPDPDLIIRTSGEKRTSGIMAYQATYAELYFTNVYFPDFDAELFQRAVLDFAARVRRFGGTAEEDLTKVDEKKLEDHEFNDGVEGNIALH